MSGNLTIGDGPHFVGTDGSVYKTESFEPVKTLVQRSWRERLLGWPWKPWAATKVVLRSPKNERVGNLPVNPA